MKRIRKFEQALKEGEWYEQKSTRFFGAIAVGVGLAVTAGVTAYGISQQSSIAGQQISLEESQNERQNTSFQQLQNLINNPNAFFSSNVYQAAFNQGSDAVARENAAAFGGNSGNEATALQGYGQSFGQQQLLSQEQLLAGMSGTQFNPAAAGSAASGAVSAAGSAGNSLAGLLAFFGTSGIGGGAGGAAVDIGALEF